MTVTTALMMDPFHPHHNQGHPLPLTVSTAVAELSSKPGLPKEGGHALFLSLVSAGNAVREGKCRLLCGGSEHSLGSTRQWGPDTHSVAP